MQSHYEPSWCRKQAKKSKKDRDEIVIPLEDLSPIAHPLAKKKLVKKLHKTIKKGLLHALTASYISNANDHSLKPPSAGK